MSNNKSLTEVLTNNKT